ncbi:MAG: ABC transporter permease [Gemmatimonadota bacterium]|nr:MAG: ABC transporter permease [Gemmatimonadota bacterium]
MDRLIRDIRFATRRLFKKPVFAITAIVSLAVGIGANTAIFSLVNAIIIRDLPFDRPEELVDVYESMEGFSHGTSSLPDIEDIRRESSEVFTDVVASRLAFIQTDVDGGIEMVTGELVSGNYFPLIGVNAQIGRTLLPEDDVTPDGHPVVMLGNSYWQRRYGGDPSVIGESIQLNGRAYTIVGVAPEDYSGSLRGLTPAVYAPIMMVGHLQSGDVDELKARGNQSAFGKARLREGVTLAQAEAVVARIAQAQREQYPGYWTADNEIVLVPTNEVIMNPMIDRFLAPAAGLMMTVVGLVLLIACANLASFLLAQAADRRKEVAIRLAMGAQRGTLVRQFLTEAFLLALMGGLAGIAIAKGLLGALVAADLPLPFPITLDLSLDGTVLGFSLLLTAGAGVFFGLVPALQATNPDVAPTLKDEGAGAQRRRGPTLRGALVMTQVAVSLMLLIGSGLFLRSLQARTAVDPGFGYDPAAVISVQAPLARYTRDEARVFFRSFLDDISAMPGVTAVGMTGDLHLSSLNNMMMGIRVDGVEPPPGQNYHLVDQAMVDPGFFEAVGISIVRGSNFAERYDPDAPRVAIVSEAMAKKFFPDGEGVGRTFRRGDSEYAVIGVARDAKVRSLGEAPRPFIYQAFDQAFSSGMTVIARTSGNADRLALDLVSTARSLDPEIMIYETKTMEAHLGIMLLPARLSAMVVSAFGLLALVLASIGLFGVVSYAVSTRSREMGIRMSLGADPSKVVWMLTKGGLRLVAVGGVIGLGLSFLAAQLLGRLLYGIESADPVTFGLVPAVMAVVALLAAWIPARRASAISPVRALRAD